MPLGILAANIIHAAGQSSPGNLSEGTYAIALSAVNETHLLKIHKRLESAGICHTLIRESDPPYAGQAMAIGVRPGHKNDLKKVLSSYRLLKFLGLPANRDRNKQSCPLEEAKIRKVANK